MLSLWFVSSSRGSHLDPGQSGSEDFGMFAAHQGHTEVVGQRQPDGGGHSVSYNGCSLCPLSTDIPETIQVKLLGKVIGL